MAKHEDLHKVTNNFGGTLDQQLKKGERTNEYQVKELLISASLAGGHGSVRQNANKLLELMSQHEWKIVAGEHGRGSQSGDQTSHLTILVKKNWRYHLRLDNKGYIFQITGPGMQDLVKPWHGPGQPHG